MPSPSPPVLHAIAWPGGICGAPRSMEESVAALRASGVDARAWLATARRVQESPVADRLRARGIPVEERTADTALAPKAVLALARSLRALGRGAILHTHGERALLWGRVASKLARVRHVHTNHGLIVNDAAQARRAGTARRLFRGLDAVVGVHEDAAAGLSGARVIPNCLDIEVFAQAAPDRDRARTLLGFGPNEGFFLFMGRLSHEKGADLLGLVQAELERGSNSARLVVAGAGPLGSGVSAMADVRLLGERSDPETVLQAADVLLMPSRQEGLPMVALEAAALGVPVVGFAVGGLADSRLAEAVPTEDVQTLVAVGLHQLRNPAARRGRLAAAREALESRFDPAGHAAALSDLYGSV